MSHEPDVFGYLATSKISEITTALLDDSTKNSYAAKKNVKFWKGPISIWATVRASRTYPHGLPIPEASKVDAASASTAGSVQPTGSEVFEVNSISFSNAGGAPAVVSVYMTDGGGSALIEAKLVEPGSEGAISLGFPLPLTNTEYLRWSSSEDVTSFIGYHTVSL